MGQDAEIETFLTQHLQSIAENNLEEYHRTTSKDLTLYEWWVTPNRLDGLPFHDFMMRESARRGAVFGSETSAPEDQDFEAHTRFDLANLHIQRYNDVAIASYTMLISTSGRQGVHVAAHNESRVMVKMEGVWKVVHVHKSPAWPAPHMQK